MKKSELARHYRETCAALTKAEEALNKAWDAYNKAEAAFFADQKCVGKFEADGKFHIRKLKRRDLNAIALKELR